ncbi:MAG: ribonuclease P protein component [Lachnospiraceae bacterium]|nr:ribonuclease P protein component [Lachnospiraceae bacterium]
MNISHLKRNEDFRNVFKKGRSFANRCFVMYVIKKEESEIRVGISVSKKVGNSVVRHRITRVVREVFRLYGAVFNSGLDIVVIARTGAVGIGLEQARKEILHLGKLHKIVDN